jgi:glycosyltransferase involved in cell wall biosynthesis
MKILHVVSYPYHGGIQSYATNLALTQAKMGHQVTLVVPTNKYVDRIISQRYNNLKVIKVPILCNLFRNPFIPFAIFKFFRIDYDIVHPHFPYPLSADIATFVAYLRNKKIVATYHCDIELVRNSLAYRAGKYINDTYLLRPALKLCDRIIATTSGYAKTSPMLRNLLKKTIFIPPGVNTEIFQPCYQYPRKILFVGMLKPEKGLEYLIKAMKYVSRASLDIVGDPVHPAYLTLLKKLVQKYNLSKKVIFWSRLSDAALIEKYKEAGVVVLPSVNRLEAFGIVLLEAMASGKPIIATDIPGPRTWIQEAFGRIVPPANSKLLAASIIDVLNNADILGREARRAVEKKFSWSRIGERILKIYKSCLEQNLCN